MRKLVAGLVLAGTTVAAGLTGAGPAHAEDGLDYAEYVHFERAVAHDVDEFWARAEGEDYQSPRFVLAARGRFVPSACGADAGDPEGGRAAVSFHAESSRASSAVLPFSNSVAMEATAIAVWQPKD